jgi:hypothetical protein
VSLVVTPTVIPNGEGFCLIGDTRPFTREAWVSMTSLLISVSGSVAMPTYRKNGGSPVQLVAGDCLGARPPGQNGPPHALFFPNGETFLSTDSVVFSWLDGWATWRITASDGSTTDLPAVAASNVAALNLVGLTFGTDLTDPTTMLGGWNVSPSIYYYNFLEYTDLMMTSTMGGDGTIVSNPSSSVQIRVNQAANNYGSYPRTPAGVRPGDYDVWWDGPAVINPFAFGGTYNVTGQTLTGGTNNVKHVTFGGDADRDGPDVFLQILSTGSTDVDGNYIYNLARPRILPAGTDPENYPILRADLPARMNAGSDKSCIRVMDVVGGNGGNAVTYADFQPTGISRGIGGRLVRAPVARIERFTGSSPAIEDAFFLKLLVTTSAPHGMFLGQIATFDPDSYQGNPPLQLADGSSTGPSGNFFVYPLTDTTLVLMSYSISANAGRQMVGVVTPTSPQAYLVVSIANGVPLSDIVLKCNLTRSHLYFTAPVSATLDALAECATYFAQNLDPGLKLRVEYGNEPWLFVSVYYFFVQQGYQFNLDAGLSPTDASTAGFYWAVGYVVLMQRVHDRMKAAWVAAGRDAADFIRVAGTQGGDSLKTTWLAQECHSRGITFDELAQGAYLDNVAAEDGKSALVNRLSPGAHADVYEAAAILGTFWGRMNNGINLPTLLGTQHDGTHLYPEFSDVTGIVYEGSPNYPAVQGGTATGNALYDLLKSIVRHPRWHTGYQQFLRVLEASGITAYHDYTFSYLDRPTEMWSAYTHTTQLPYFPGDPTQDAIQIDTPLDIRPGKVKAVTPGAINSWQLRRAGSVASPDFTLSSISPVTVAPGATATASIHLNAFNAYTGTAALSFTAPTGITGIPTPSGLTGGGTVSGTLAVSVLGSVSPGTYTGTLTGHDTVNNLTHTASLSVTVTGSSSPPPPTPSGARPKQIYIGRRRWA